MYGDNWEPADLEKRGSVLTCPVMKNATMCLLSEGLCLFDLDKDPCEQNNIAASHPEVHEGYSIVAHKMRTAGRSSGCSASSAS